MNTEGAAAALFEEAKLILDQELPAASKAGNHRLVVRRAQEVVELLVKACIRRAGYDYPKVHDAAPVLVRLCEEQRMALSAETLKRIQDASASLAEERAPAFYAERDYSEREAEQALSAARFVFQALSEFLTRRGGP